MNVPATQHDQQVAALEKVLIEGDLKPLSAEQRVAYVNRVCESLGLNPMTRPFDYIPFQGKTVLYARKDCAEQLRKLNGISVEILTQGNVDGGLFSVEVRASDKHGRIDHDMGVVSIVGLKGEALANAHLKAVTKAKRRVTLSISGLGMLDASEIEGVAEARPITNPLDGLSGQDKAAADFQAPLEVEELTAEPLHWDLLKSDGVVYWECGTMEEFLQAYHETQQRILGSDKSTPREKMTSLKELFNANTNAFANVPSEIVKELEEGRNAHNRSLGVQQSALDNEKAEAAADVPEEDTTPSEDYA